MIWIIKKVSEFRWNILSFAFSYKRRAKKTEFHFFSVYISKSTAKSQRITNTHITASLVAFDSISLSFGSPASKKNKKKRKRRRRRNKNNNYLLSLLTFGFRSISILFISPIANRKKKLLSKIIFMKIFNHKMKSNFWWFVQLFAALPFRAFRFFFFHFVTVNLLPCKMLTHISPNALEISIINKSNQFRNLWKKGHLNNSNIHTMHCIHLYTARTTICLLSYSRSQTRQKHKIRADRTKIGLIFSIDHKNDLYLIDNNLFTDHKKIVTQYALVFHS